MRPAASRSKAVVGTTAGQNTTQTEAHLFISLPGHAGHFTQLKAHQDQSTEHPALVYPKLEPWMGYESSVTSDHHIRQATHGQPFLSNFKMGENTHTHKIK